jgi:hypothetical protein
VVFVDEFGAQYVDVETNQPDMKTLKFVGLSGITGARVGSAVALEYEVTFLGEYAIAGVWKGSVVS